MDGNDSMGKAGAVIGALLIIGVLCSVSYGALQQYFIEITGANAARVADASARQAESIARIEEAQVAAIQAAADIEIAQGVKAILGAAAGAVEGNTTTAQMVAQAQFPAPAPAPAPTPALQGPLGGFIAGIVASIAVQTLDIPAYWRRRQRQHANQESASAHASRATTAEKGFRDGNI